MTAANFDRCLKAVLVHEGGNDDDPRDPGGRTSRGIIQTEYDAWRTRQGLPKRDVWTASDAEVRAIYFAEYWKPLACDDLPPGVDYAVFDYGVNSGIGRSAKQLQIIVGATPDGMIGPKTEAAVAANDSTAVATKLCDERLSFLQDLRTWRVFGRGWGQRVADVRATALAMISEHTGVAA